MTFEPAFAKVHIYMTNPISESRRGRGRPSFQEVLNLLDEEVGLLKSSLGGLPRAVEADEILHAIWLDDVHNSTAIEGNTMTRAQVANLVRARPGIGSPRREPRGQGLRGRGGLGLSACAGLSQRACRGRFGSAPAGGETRVGAGAAT